MWFFHCLQEFGIEVTNKINKSAIGTLSSVEIARVQKVLDCIKSIENFHEFKIFFDEASKLMIPDFMNVKFTFPEIGRCHMHLNGSCSGEIELFL